MKHTYSSEYGKIKIKPLAEENIEDMRVLRNKHRDCFIYSEEITAEAQAQWYGDYLDKKNDYMFSVFYKGKWIGSVSIYNITGQSAEFGRLLIDKDAVDTKGLGADTTICVCNLAFQQMNVKKIYLQVYESNVVAYKTYVKAGFCQCGVSYDNSGNKLIDMVLNKE